MVRVRLRRIASIALVVALLVIPASHAHSTMAHDDDAAETAVRVMAVDGATGQLTILDPASGAVVGRFTTPTGGYVAVGTSGTGRYFLAVHYEGEHVTIVDSGLSLESHGDHADLVAANPFVVATLPVGSAPLHQWAHDGVLAVHVDGDGTVVLFDESALNEQVVTTKITLAQPDHTSIAVLDDALLAGYYELGRIDAFSLDGTLLQENIVACPGAHGEAHFGDAIVFGCADGLAWVTSTSGTFVAEKVPYPAVVAASSSSGDPAATPVSDGPRVGTLAAHHDGHVLVGDFGNALVLITMNGETPSMNILDLPGDPLSFTYGRSGEDVVVLTDDGAVHAIDPVAGSILWSAAAVTPYADIEIGDGFAFYPAIAATDAYVYVPDAGTGEIVEIDRSTGQTTNRFAVGGQPARVTLTTVSGVVHE